jgi:hypothetical protein
MYDIGIRSDSILNFHATRTENTEIHYCWYNARRVLI